MSQDLIEAARAKTDHAYRRFCDSKTTEDRAEWLDCRVDLLIRKNDLANHKLFEAERKISKLEALLRDLRPSPGRKTQFKGQTAILIKEVFGGQ